MGNQWKKATAKTRQRKTDQLVKKQQSKFIVFEDTKEKQAVANDGNWREMGS